MGGNGEQQGAVLSYVNAEQRIAADHPLRPWLGGLPSEERNDPGFEKSQKQRKRVEQVFGWIQEVAGMRQTKFRGGRRWNVPLGAQRAESAAHAAPAASDGLGEGKGLATGVEIEPGHTKIARATGGEKHCSEVLCRKTSIFPQPVKPCPDTNPGSGWYEPWFSKELQ